MKISPEYKQGSYFTPRIEFLLFQFSSMWLLVQTSDLCVFLLPFSKWGVFIAIFLLALTSLYNECIRTIALPLSFKRRLPELETDDETR